MGRAWESGVHEQNHGWLFHTFSHIELAPIFTAETGRPVAPLTGVDSNYNDAFPLSSRPLGLGRNSVQTPPAVTVDFRILKYFPFGAWPLGIWMWLQNHSIFLTVQNVEQINPVYGSNLTPIPGFEQPILELGARQIQFSLDFEF